MPRGRGKRKTMVGTVVSDKMDKTVVVRVETLRRHPLYKKTIRHIKKVKAHDEGNACRVGDKVLIMETRPLSKEKRWRVVQILERVEEAVPLEVAEGLEGPQGEMTRSAGKAGVLHDPAIHATESSG